MAHTSRFWKECVLIDSVKRDVPGREITVMDIRDSPHFFKINGLELNLAILTDVIEHLTGPDANRLLGELASICKAIVVFTPIGWYCVNAKATDPDTHKSGWWPRDFHKNGWAVWE
jgi:hypothetical protein